MIIGLPAFVTPVKLWLHSLPRAKRRALLYGW